MGWSLGIDVGTTSIKVGVFDEAGSELAAASREYRLQTPAPDRVEADAELYWQGAVEVARRCLAQPGADPRRVTALAVSSQGETLIPVDVRGDPLAPAIVWLDNRAQQEAELVRERFPGPELYLATGVPAATPTWPACKLLWWRLHEPEIYRATHRFQLVEEFLLQRLTGRFVAESGVQATSLLLDITERRWWQPMLEWLGLGRDRLAELIHPGDVVGRLTPAAAEALGLGSGVLVVAGGMDQGAGAVGVGNLCPGVLSESTGGALTVQASVTAPAGRRAPVPVYIHSAPSLFLYCPVSPTGGMALTWFRDRFTPPLTDGVVGAAVASYEILMALAAGVAPGADGLTVLPHLAGALSPADEPNARGAVFGLTLAHGREHLVRAILESVAFMLRENVELLGQMGAGAPEIRSHGGGARSALWNQIKADVCSLPVVTVEGTQAAVRGDAMLAGVASGAFSSLDQAAEAAVRIRARFEPDARSRPSYEEAYRRYQDIFQAMRPLFRAAPAPAEGGKAGGHDRPDRPPRRR
ncbi:MAG: xylulokinase [Candidatus Dormibacteria bacterium]